MVCEITYRLVNSTKYIILLSYTRQRRRQNPLTFYANKIL